MHISRKTRVLSVLCVAWMVLIFLFSAQDVDRSTHASNLITRFLLIFIEPGEHEDSVPASTKPTDSASAAHTDAPAAPAKTSSDLSVDSSATSHESAILPNRDMFGVDRNYVPVLIRKTAHLFLFSVLGILVFETVISHRKQKLSSVFLSVCFCFLYACTDEIHQYFVDGRSAQFSDVLLDTFGALFGILLVIGISSLRRVLFQKS